MKKLLLFLLVLIGLVAGILFTSAGQKSVLLPLANFALSDALPGHEIRLSRLRPALGSLQLEGTLDREIRFQAQGPVAWVKRRFDLRYRITAATVHIEKRTYPVELEIRGTARGTPALIKIDGAGRGFGARLDYRFSLARGELRGAQLRAHGAQVAQLLALAGTAPYANGRLDLQVDMPRLEGHNPQGSAHFTVHDGTLDPGVIRRDFSIDLPPVKRYDLEGTFRLAKGLIRGDARLKSPLMDLRIQQFRSDLSLRIFKSDYTMEIPQLSRLKALTGIELYGPFKASGAFYLDRKKRWLQLRGQSPSLEGSSRFFYDNGRLELTLNKVGIPQLLALTGQKPLAERGSLDATVKLSRLSPPSGTFRLRASGRWDRAELAKLTGGDPGDALDFSLRGDGNLSKGVLSLDAGYDTPLFTLELTPLRYALKDGAMEGSYRLRLPDLGRFKPLKELGSRGAVKLNGSLSYLPVKRLMKIEGESSSLGGSTRFRYAGKRLNLTIRKADATKVLRLLGREELMKEGSLDASLDLSDLERRIGSFRLGVRGTVSRRGFTELTGTDPGRELPVKLKGEGTLQGRRVDSHWNLESAWGQLNFSRCRLNLETKACRGHYALKIPKLQRLRPFTGRTLHGPLSLGGRLRYDRTLHLDGGGKEWGGRFDYVLETPLLRVKTRSMELKALMKMLGYPSLVDGRLSSDLRYNLGNRKGSLDARIAKARFVSGPLTLVASRLLHLDLAKESFDPVTLTAKIDGPTLRFDLLARSPRMELRIRQGTVDRDRGRIDAVVEILKSGKRYKLRIRGPLGRPSVTPIVTDALVQKAQKELKKHHLDKKIQKAIPKEIRDEGNPIGNFIKKLF